MSFPPGGWIAGWAPIGAGAHSRRHALGSRPCSLTSDAALRASAHRCAELRSSRSRDDPAQLTLFRSLSAALVGGIVLAATDRRGLHVSRRELANLAVLGIVGVAVIQWLYAVAIGRLPIGIALLIECTAVLILARRAPPCRSPFPR
jgi:hypothetical protein